MANKASSSSSSSRKTKTPHNDDLVAESTHEIVTAAQKLMQLSEHDNNNNIKEFDQIQSDTKIDENSEIIDRPKKMKKYRSIVSIYKVTRPINVRRR
ncbi:hypothetical protein Lalb_Chr23g0272461 [Lupinus albus]|uniref:Uncharacterized protein n=1 Tax=Lupinus albus TaxID=3870 RepID=A0A6A4MWB0_LUPAL|nr:hypothetical protein Lalb_Chr23g0272461 [Lupinus albus]